MKKMIIAGLCMLIWSGQAMAVCQTASITASTPTADFVDHGNGTVTHTRTGLMWKQCSEGLSGASCATGTATAHTWQAALQLAETLNAGAGFATFNDWRVPNQKELNSIVERQCVTPSINAAIFPATVSNLYWSASPYAGAAPYAGNATAAWNVDFTDGSDNVFMKAGFLYVRLVRGGQ